MFEFMLLTAGVLLGIALTWVTITAIQVRREGDQIQRMIDQQRWAEKQLRQWENDNHVR